MELPLPEWMPFGVAIETLEAGAELEFSPKTKQVRKRRETGKSEEPNGQQQKPKETEDG